MNLDALLALFTLESLFFMCMGTILGILFGALPGLTTVLAVVLFTPMTYGMEPIPAMMLLLGLYCGGSYGGSITAILINTPGTPAASATCVDGYPMTKKGQARKGLEMALVASVIGGLISGVVLLVAAPQIAKITLLFTSAEYFCLALFGLSVIISVSSKDLFGGIISGCLGLFISTIGIDTFSGAYRFTFGNIKLASGIETLILMIGVFAVSELMIKSAPIVNKVAKEVRKLEGVNMKGEEGLTLKECLQCMRTIIVSAFIGVGVGAMPGTGGGVAAFISYDVAKRSSKESEEFGNGAIEGVAATESANNGVTGAALIPLFTMGIPGDGVTAVFLGALMIHGLVPGPELFTKSADVVYPIIIGFIIINVLLLLQGKLLLPWFSKIATVSDTLLIPLIMLFCGAGAYAVRNNTFDLMSIVALGLLSFIMQKLKFPMLPMVLGVVLGKIAEENFRRSMLMSLGDIPVFFTRPICIGLLLLTAGFIGTALWKQYKQNRADVKKEAEANA